MWKTSFIQFLKILRQNKFFTFLNLFGVSITIAIILIVAVKLESTIWPGGPEKNNQNMLFINNEVIRNEEAMSMGGVKLAIIEDYILEMKSPKQVAFYSETPWSYFGENGVEEFNLKNVNAAWWHVFNYEFLSGRSFNLQEVDNASFVAVIDQKVENRFFGDKTAVGQLLEISGKTYTIVGVIENVPSNCQQATANIFVPYTLTSGYNRNLMETGSFNVAFLAHDKNNILEIKTEFESIRKRIIPLLEDDKEIFFGGPDGPLDYYLRGWDTSEDYAGRVNKLLILFAKFMLIMLLPALNLISIQLIRIHERSEEIGVRKAFGASRGELVRQILYENTLLTFVGALLGLLIAMIVVYGFTDFITRTLFTDFGEGFGGNVSLSINYMVFVICILSSLILSLVSGIIPAIKMSRLHPVEVLKGGEL